MPDMLIIFNPFSNRGDSKHTMDRVLQSLAQSSLDFEVKLTEDRRHAIQLAREAAEAGTPIVVAAGGDGTVNEVANGILLAAKGQDGVSPTTLGVLPMGSGNDFAWGLGIRDGVEEAVDRLKRGHTKVIDVAWAEFDNAPPRFFVNMLGCGFDARVNIEAHKIKRLRGFAIYMAAVLKTLWVYFETPPVRLQLDDKTLETPSFITFVANGPRLGGGFLAVPQARYDDGILDLCIAQDVTRPEVFPLIPKLIKGKHTGHPKILMDRAKHVVIESDHPLPCQADGETIGENLHLIRIVTIPQRLRVIV
ncbi:MAG TPA: diacylglycerol kinase family lipid kinase [Anaerolineae bacterium]|nr:diacylglycerol kinase family lipid kinase [Anaerolineae bacterium]